MSLPRYSRYQETGVDWLGTVPAHWRVRRVGYFFSERRKKVSDKDFQPLSVTKNGVVPQLETAAKTDDGDNRKLVCAGDFVINSRSDRKGSSGASALDGSVSLINTVLRPESEISIRFAHHLFRSVPFQEEYYRFGKGIVADLWSTNFSEMRNISVAVPDLAEQNAIADFLDGEAAKFDALIAEQEKLLALLAEKRQATISRAVIRGLDSGADLKESGISWLGLVPVHWEIVPLKCLLSDVKAGPFGSALTKDMYVPNGYRVYGQEQVIAADFSIGDYCISDEKYAELQQYAVKSGDILVSCVGTFGKIAMVPEGVEPGIINPRLIRLRVAERILGGYLELLLRSRIVFEQLSVVSRGGTMDVINIGSLKTVLLALPPIEEQDGILTYLDEKISQFDALMEVAKNAISLLKERRSALISAVVTGKIDVRGLVDAKAAA